jgi:hypothetical protein
VNVRELQTAEYSVAKYSVAEYSERLPKQVLGQNQHAFLVIVQ